MKHLILMLILLVETAQAGPNTHILGSFESDLEPFNRTGLLSIRAQISPEHATDGHFALLWKSGYLGWDAHQDWSRFEWLSFDAFNPSTSPFLGVVEVKDKDSTDYWSRANYPFVVPAGAHAIRIPTRLYAGEKSRPGRAIDPRMITSITLARLGGHETELYIDALRLESDGPPEAPNIHAFDFGPEDSPLFPGMTRITAATTYAKERGYGFTHVDIWNPYPQASDALQPDSLYRDCVMISTAEFVIDLPDGEYELFLNIDHAGGYWGEYPHFRRRRIYNDDTLLLDESGSFAQAATSYFHFWNRIDRPGEDVFDLYLPQIFHEKRLRATSSQGRLRLRFEGDDCSQGCFGLALSTLIVAPASDSLQLGQYLSSIRERRKQEFRSYFRELVYEQPAATLSPSLVPVDAAVERPTAQIGKTLHITGVRGEIASATALLEVAHASSIPVTATDLLGSSLIPNQQIALYRVVPRITRVSMDGSLYTVAPRYLFPLSAPLQGDADRQQLWITVSIPADAKPGSYTGFLVAGALTLPVALTVLPFSLPPVDLPIGSFASNVQENFWTGPEMEQRGNKLALASLQTMRKVGLTTFSAAPLLSVSATGSSITIDSRAFRAEVNLAKSLGFTAVVGYKDIIAGFDLCRDNPAQHFGMSENEFLPKFGEAVARLAQQEQWLPVRMIVCDEPTESELAAVSRRLSLLNQSSGAVPFSVTLSDEHDRRKTPQIVKFPYVFLNAFDDTTVIALNRSKVPFAFYNRARRETLGFYLYRLKKTSTIDLRIAWTWNQNAANPFYALDSREDDYSWCTSTPDAELLCTVFLERHVREGVTDYRYARLLDETVRQAQGSDRADGDALLKQVMTFPASSDYPPNQDNPDWQRAPALRQKIIEYLLRRFR